MYLLFLQLVQDAPVVEPMDLALRKGNVVGVIREGDPMGNKDRWFVDDGGMYYIVLYHFKLMKV